jgi:hypothetical protein
MGDFMRSRIRQSAIAATLCSIFGLATGIALADVTVERTTSVNGAGAMAFANMTGTSRTIISGNKSRTDSDTKMQSKIVGFLARNATGPSADIVLLDQDLMYHLNINKKEYTEMTFEQLHAQMQKASDQMNSNDQKQQPSAVDQSKCDWLPATVDIDKTGEKAQLAGYDSERVTITAKQPCKDKDTGAICEVALILDQWMSPGVSESAETRQFYKAYATKMGVDLSQDPSQKARSFFSQYKDIWAQVATKMQNVKGYPVRSSFTLALGGPQCKDPRAQSGQADDNSAGSGGGIAGAMAGKLGGLFHKKSDDAAASSAPPVAPVAVPAGDVALMTISSQLVSISADAASPDVFGLPPDFKKVELKTQ